jgi:hypothetical protein
MSDGVGHHDEPVRGEQGDRGSARADLLLFYEYFHGDNGAGLGASLQTGWTGLVAKTIQLYGLLDAKGFLEGGKGAAFLEGTGGGAARG